MGYRTDFSGSFKLDKSLTTEHAAYLKAFSWSRRMKRDAAKTAERSDIVRKAAGLGVGVEGGYFVGESGFMGQDFGGHDIIDVSQPPKGQPNLWCHWIPSEDGTAIEWDYGERFYDYTDWIAYLIHHFLEPWGYVVNGEVEWQGEDPDDIGKIVVKNNMVSALAGRKVYG